LEQLAKGPFDILNVLNVLLSPSAQNLDRLLSFLADCKIFRTYLILMGILKYFAAHVEHIGDAGFQIEIKLGIEVISWVNCQRGRSGLTCFEDMMSAC
jgi:hypothetical protein